MKRETILGLVIVLALSSLSFAKQPEYKPGSVLVRFKNTDTQPPNTAGKNIIINTTLGTTGTPVKQEYTLVQGLAKVTVPANMTVENAVAALKNSPSVLYAEPDYIYHTSVVPNDPSFSQLWGMTIIGAPAAWDITTGSSSIIVAVTDTGVDYTHTDLAANIWSDANGAHGYDFVNNDGDPMDDHGHGTHLSGTIGAVGNNSIGVAGVNWHTKIMALKCFDATGSGTTSAEVAAIQYAIANGAKVINASWGGYG
jgi:subtilisin family serine protease